MALVTVVIPTHNRSGLLSRTLRSVLAQRGVELQVIVVDDGSSDDTPSMVARLADARVTLLRNERALGVSSARNRGIAAAAGQWIAFLDDDDLWAPEKLARQVGGAESTGRLWACCGTVTVSPSLEIVAGSQPSSPEKIVARLPWRNMIPAGASNVVAHVDALARTGGFDTGLRHISDWDLWIRLGQVGPPAVVPEPLLAYVLHEANASSDTSTISAELAIVEERYAALRHGAPIDHAYVHRWAAWHYLRNGQQSQAIRSYVRAVGAGDARSIGRAIVALIDPGIARRGMRRHGTQSQLAAGAAGWLQELAS
jgi:glycosyltransferase involved in cell wall biosynthesis